MNNKRHILSISYALVVIVMIGSVLIAYTYAWFTANEKVYTTTIKAETGSDDIVMLLGSQPGNLKQEPCVIEEDNMDGNVVLYPVSTADLKTFVAMEGKDTNTTYRKVSDQDQYYYHGVFYLQIQGEKDKNVMLYLDQRENTIVETGDDSQVLNASRFAFVINGQGSIITLSNDSNQTLDQIENTYVNGVKVEGEQVITLDDNGDPEAVNADTVYLEDAVIRNDGEQDIYPDYMYEIRTNEIYTCDVYFYLEGTDKDCSNALWSENLEMQISLLGVSG